MYISGQICISAMHEEINGVKEFLHRLYVYQVSIILVPV